MAGRSPILLIPGESCEIRACAITGNIHFFRIIGAGFAELGMEGACLPIPQLLLSIILLSLPKAERDDPNEARFGLISSVFPDLG